MKKTFNRNKNKYKSNLNEGFDIDSGYNRKSFNNKSSRSKFGKRKTPNYMDNLEYGYQGKPVKNSDVQCGLSIKALKDLPHSSYSVTADPYTAALPTSGPYPIINVFNRSYGGNYSGDLNLDGGNVQQYANSFNSKFLSCFDVFRLKLKLNYQYLPIVPTTSASYAGKQLINEVRKAISEAISVLQSTTYTQMAINNFVVATDLPLGSAETIEMGTTAHGLVDVYTNKADVFYAMSIFYQLVLQDTLNTLKWHNAFRLKQGTAIRNGWDREVGVLNAFFGLMNKASFRNLINSINLFFEGEYVDKAFMAQASMINYAPSRKSNDIFDPILEIQTSFNTPTKFKVYVTNSNGELVWDDANNDYAKVFDFSDLSTTIENETLSLFEINERLNDLLSLEATTLYARTSTYTGTLGDVSRFNTIKKYVDGMIRCLNNFKPKWTDFRQALDTLSRAGITRWEKGYRPEMETATDAPLFNNLLLNDIYRFVLSGAKDLVFNDQTKRWSTFSLWDKYYGIPEYDKYSGGAFLTYSFKNIVATTDSDANIEYLPLMFNYETVGDSNVICVAVNRGGPHTVDSISYSDYAVEAKITASDVQISSNKILTRLTPLSSQDNLVMRVPTVTFVNNPDLNDTDRSLIYSTLISILGCCKVGTSSTTVDFGLDPNILAVYQVEIEDTTNMALAYSRNCGPIRGTTSTVGQIGFTGLTSK